MGYYLYIIESISSGDLYKGISEDINKRLKYHNSGLSKFTKSAMPWKLVFLREYESKSEALKEELRLKRCNRKYLDWYIHQATNKLGS